MKLEYASITLRGTAHERNEDRALLGMRSMPPESGAAVCGEDEASRAFAVFDGVGGHNGGALAAEEALAGFSRACADARIQPAARRPQEAGVNPGEREQAESAADSAWRDGLASALGAANARIVDLRFQGARIGFCAAAGVAFDGRGHAHVFHAGDVRVYRFRPPYAVRLTKDHSLAEQWRDEHPGQNPPDEIAHTITRSLGHQIPAGHADDAAWPFDVERPAPALAGDIYLACSDGIWEYVREEDLESAFANASCPADLADAVDGLARLARERGSYDDATAVAVRVA